MTIDQHLDYDVINNLKDIMDGDFTFLIETYFQDSTNRITALRNAVAIKDGDNIRRAAHSFKGSCSNLGALRLASLCAALEQSGVQGNFASIDNDIDVLEQEYNVVKGMLQEFLQ